MGAMALLVVVMIVIALMLPAQQSPQYYNSPTNQQTPPKPAEPVNLVFDKPDDTETETDTSNINNPTNTQTSSDSETQTTDANAQQETDSKKCIEKHQIDDSDTQITIYDLLYPYLDLTLNHNCHSILLHNFTKKLPFYSFLASYINNRDLEEKPNIFTSVHINDNDYQHLKTILGKYHKHMKNTGDIQIHFIKDPLTYCALDFILKEINANFNNNTPNDNDHKFIKIDLLTILGNILQTFPDPKFDCTVQPNNFTLLAGYLTSLQSDRNKIDDLIKYVCGQNSTFIHTDEKLTQFFENLRKKTNYNALKPIINEFLKTEDVSKFDNNQLEIVSEFIDSVVTCKTSHILNVGRGLLHQLLKDFHKEVDIASDRADDKAGKDDKAKKSSKTVIWPLRSAPCASI